MNRSLGRRRQTPCGVRNKTIENDELFVATCVRLSSLDSLWDGGGDGTALHRYRFGRFVIGGSGKVVFFSRSYLATIRYQQVWF